MEISPFLGTLLGNIVIAIGIVVVVSIIKLIKDKLNTYLEYITATTVGLLLGIIFLGFLPELSAEGSLDGKDLGIFILLGVFLFYLLELFLHWHHCKDLGHQDSCHSHHNHEHKNGIMMFGGTLLHNIFHGIVLFGAFAIDMHFGIATTVAILLHSIPQNIVNYIMNHNNIKYSYFAAFGGIIGALLTFPFSGFLLENKFYILAIITGGLLYTALADIFPEFNGKANISKKIAYLFFIFIGIFLFIGFEELTHHEHNEEHEKHELHEEHDDNKYKHDKEEKIEEINNKESKLPNTKIERVCFENNGKRITGTRECEGIGENICKQIGGKFNSCASACRNNPEAKICTMQCVQVCKF